MRARLLLALTVLLVAATPAGAATTPIASGSLDWGVKASFRSYIAGPIAHGSIEVAGGATTNADGSFRFPLTGGSFDDETGTTSVAFGGSVRFRGHDGALDLTIADVRVELAPDGSRLLADVSSVPFPAGGAPVVYPDTELVALDTSGVEPMIDGGSTSWSAIPGVLTASGAPAFGGFYQAGTAFDPLSFAYVGPGGKPVLESWTEPGTPVFGSTDGPTALGGFSRLFVDRERGVLHAVTGTGVHAYDLETLEPRGAYAETDLEQFGIAFDPETGTVFARKGTGNVLAYAWSDGAYARSEVPLAGKRTLDYDPATNKLWAIGTLPPAATFQGPPSVSVATRDGGGWTVQDYPPIETGARNVNLFARSSTGALLGSYGAELVGGAPQPHPTAVFEDTGSALVPTDVEGTVPTLPSGTTIGYGVPVAGPDGLMALQETTINSSTARVLLLRPSEAAPSGYAVDGDPVDVGPTINGLAFDGTDGSMYVSKQAGGSSSCAIARSWRRSTETAAGRWPGATASSTPVPTPPGR